MVVRLMFIVVVIAFALQASPQEPPPTAAEIMKWVAENQDREQKARTQFVYDEMVHRVMRRKDGKLLREEYRTFAVVPSAKGAQKKLQSVKGQYWRKGKYVAFESQSIPPGGLFNATFDDSDSAESHTKDGIDKDLFPLTSDEQKKYTFELTGERAVQGRFVYQIQFHPTDRNEYGWAGEALIDKEEFQPVSIYTRLSRRLPVAVRTVLGTDVPGLGFSVQYTRVEKDLWFPATYGTEFGVHALFLLNRTFTESVENKNFRRTTVESRIEYGDHGQ
jgi:hypothetical protein